MTEVWKICVSLLIAYGFVLLATLVWKFILTPAILASEREAVISEQTKTLSRVTDTSKDAERQETLTRKTRQRFAKILAEGKAIEEQILLNNNPHDHNSISVLFTEWIKTTTGALTEAGLQTDATVFQYCGERPSGEQMKLVPVWLDKQTWKHLDVIRASIYLAKLQEIVERRNL